MKTNIAAFGKKILGALGIEYCCFRVFSLDLDALPEVPELPSGYRYAEVTGDDVRKAREPAIQREAWYFGEDALGFGVFFGPELVALQWIWYGEAYRRKRNFWPLEPNEAKSVELVTAASHRGKGLATCLKQYSAKRLAEQGFARVYSRIWWNNWPSIRVSEKAGWQAVAVVAEMNTPLRSRPFRFLWRLRSKPVQKKVV